MYVARLRCQTWHVWPEKTVIEASSFTLDLGDGKAMRAQLAVVSFLNRTEPATFADEETELGPLMWTGAIPGLYTIRESVMKASEDEIKATLAYKHARRGEVDVSIAFPYEGDLTAAGKEAVRCTLFATMSLLNLRLKDFLTPVAPVQIRQYDDSRAIVSNFTLAVRNRRVLKAEELNPVVTRVAHDLFSSIDADKRRIALELYGSPFFERQARTRFLLLVIAMEALSQGAQKHPVAISMLDRWQSELTAELSRPHVARWPESHRERSS